MDDEIPDVGADDEERPDHELVPTPEELEGGEAPTARTTRPAEPIAEQSSGFLERVRMRLKRGVGRRRKYVTVEEGSPEEGPDDGEPGENVPAPEDSTDDPPAELGVMEADTSREDETERDGSIEEERDEEPAGPRGSEEHMSDDDRDRKGGPASSSGGNEPGERRVGSVTFGKQGKRKPAGKRRPKAGAEKKPKNQRERRLDELHNRAKEHGHSLGAQTRQAGTDNIIFTCTKCGLRATLVGDQEEMSNSFYWGIRGRALEKRCTGEKRR